MSSASGGLITERTLFPDCFTHFAAGSVRHRVCSTSRVNAALSCCFMLESFIDIGEDHPLGGPRAGLVCIVVLVGGVSRSGACDAWAMNFGL